MALALDTLCDRREVWRLLHRLPPGKRVRFLQWAASQAKGIGGNKPVHTTPARVVEAATRDYGNGADTNLTNSLYTELGMLYCQWDVSQKLVAEELEKRVQRHEREET